MAETIDLYRRANSQQTGRSMGADPRQPRTMTLGIKVQAHGSDVIGLPEHEDGCPPLQVLDTTSPDFGKFYFLPSYDAVGSDHPIR